MKKRLLLITNGFPFGESERSFLSEEVKCLAAEYDLYVMAPQNNDKLIYPTDGIVHIDRYAFSSLHKARDIGAFFSLLQPAVVREVYELAKKNHFASSLRDLKEVLSFRFHVWEMEQKIGRLVESEQIRIVYTYWCSECTLAAVMLKRKFPKLKVITRFHGMDLYEERTENGWQPFRREIARRADGLCFACEPARAYFAARWGNGCEEKMHLCYLGSADRGALDMHQDEKLQIVSCSNLIPLKRVELIIKGLALLPDTLQVKWTVFGDGTERRKLESLAEETLRHCPHIDWEFRGFVPNDILTEEYRKIAPQLFITTSSTEGGAPVSIQEVFSMGIPAIGTPVGGIPDLIENGKTGFLLPADTQSAHVAEAIQRFAALTTKQKSQMSDAARQHWAEKFDAKKNAQQFAAYLRNLALE